MSLRHRAPPGVWPWLGAAALLLLALADPRWPSTQLRWSHIVIVDITQSMNTRDMPLPGGSAAVIHDSRLAFVRHALQRAVADLPCGSRLGLGVFTEYRSLLLLSPLEVCAHFDELLAVVGRIDGRMAWASSSEVTRGVESALRVTEQWSQAAAQDLPSLIFVTDGHESPPLRGGVPPSVDLPAQPVAGWLLGVGGDTPMPIPKFDPLGHSLGYWEAHEVMQTDAMSLGRTVGGAAQSLVEADGRPVEVFRGAGLEHLSSLKESHLQAVAQATGVTYRRLRDAEQLSGLMRAPELARPMRSSTSWRWLPALAALLLLAWPFVPRPRVGPPAATPPHPRPRP